MNPDRDPSFAVDAVADFDWAVEEQKGSKTATSPGGVRAGLHRHPGCAEQARSSTQTNPELTSTRTTQWGPISRTRSIADDRKFLCLSINFTVRNGVRMQVHGPLNGGRSAGPAALQMTGNSYACR